MLDIEEHSTITTAIDVAFGSLDRVQLLPDGKILITEGQHMAAVYDESTKSAIKSWTFSQLSSLSCPIVYDKCNNLIVSVHKNITLKQFGIDEEVEAVKKLKFTQSIFCVVPAPDGELILVHSNGFMATLSEAIDTRMDADKPDLISGAKIDYVRILNGTDAVSISAVVISKVGPVFTYHKLRLDRETGDLENESCELPNAVLYGVNEDGLLVVLKSTGEICRIVNGKLVTAYTLPQKMSDIKSIISLSPKADLLAVPWRVAQGPNYMMEMIDLKHNLSENFALPQSPLRYGISVIASKFYVLTAKGLDIIPFAKKPVALSSAVGKTKTETTNPDITIQKETLLDSLKNLSTDGLITELNRLKQLNNDYVPEKILAEIVNHILSRDDLEDNDFDTTFSYLMTLPYNVHFLTSQIRSLNLPVPKVLALTNKMLLKLENPALKGDVCVNVLDWISAVLDANFQQIIISAKQFKEPLLKLRDFVDVLCEYSEDLLSLKSTMELVISSSSNTAGNQLKSTEIELPIKPIGDYSVDVIYV